MLIFAAALVAQTINAQTFHKDLYAEVNDYVFCLNAHLVGSWTYHVSYHVEKKSGNLTKLHWNVKNCDLKDLDGNRYKLIDTGNDTYLGPLNSLGGISYVDLWNNVNAFNEGYDITYFDVDDGWIEAPTALPYEGSVVGTFKFIGPRGDKVTFKEVTVYRINANGNVTVEFSKIFDDCNW